MRTRSQAYLYLGAKLHFGSTLTPDYGAYMRLVNTHNPVFDAVGLAPVHLFLLFEYRMYHHQVLVLYLVQGYLLIRVQQAIDSAQVPAQESQLPAISLADSFGRATPVLGFRQIQLTCPEPVRPGLLLMKRLSYNRSISSSDFSRRHSQGQVGGIGNVLWTGSSVNDHFSLMGDWWFPCPYLSSSGLFRSTPEQTELSAH